jgi:hypothetical protein
MTRNTAFVCFAIVACGGGLPSVNDAGDAGNADAPIDASMDDVLDGSAGNVGDESSEAAVDTGIVDTGVIA